MSSIDRNQPEDNLDHLRGSDAVDKIREIAEKAQTCFFCTMVAAAESHGVRPMNVREVDDEGNFWFLSADDSNTWATRNGEVMHLRVGGRAIEVKPAGSGRGVRFSPDGSRLLAGLTVFDTSTGNWARAPGVGSAFRVGLSRNAAQAADGYVEDLSAACFDPTVVVVAGRWRIPRDGRTARKPADAPGLRLIAPRLTPAVKRLAKLAIPGAIAGGVTQINIVIGTIIASLAPGAVSYLYYADRVYQLPLGIVGVAIGVVLLPDLARQLRAGRADVATHTQNRAIEFSLALTLPAAIALVVLATPIIRARSRGRLGSVSFGLKSLSGRVVSARPWARSACMMAP